MISSFPQIFAVGHKATRDLFGAPVEVTEKIDGSFWGMGLVDGELCMRSKGQSVVAGAAGMFDKATETAAALDLHPGWTYYGEYLAKPKHNSLAYDRCPEKHIIVFGIMRASQDFLPYEEMSVEADRLGLETVPLICSGTAKAGQWEEWLERTSVLGGQKIEGFVVRSSSLYELHTNKVLHAKFVSEKFKETHSKEWKVSNPSKANVVERIIETLRTPARWDKAVQHMRDGGRLVGAPQDIGPLLREIVEDTLAEEGDWIRDQLFSWCEKDIKRGIVRGVPEWFKERLLEGAFVDA